MEPNKSSIEPSNNESSTSTLNPNENLAQDCGTVTKEALDKMQMCGFYVEGIALAILGSFAVLTNIFTLYVFVRKEAKNSFNLLIVVLTCVDLIFCVLLMSDYCFVRAFGIHTVTYTIMFPHVVYPAVNITMTASIYMTVVLALERYIAICYPLIHRNISHSYSITKRVCFYTLPVMFLSVLINLPKFFETKVVRSMRTKKRLATKEEISQLILVSGPSSTPVMSENESIVQNKSIPRHFIVDMEEGIHIYDNVTSYSIDVTDLRDSETYIKYYMNIFQTMVLGVIPFCALIFFNIKIYHRFILTRGRFQGRSTRGSTQAKDLHLSLILICVICVFVITNFPRLLLNLYEMFHCDAIIACGDRFFPPAWFICSTAFNHLLLVVNCVMNFVVYCYFNNSFRATICDLCTKWGICKPVAPPPANNGPEILDDVKNGTAMAMSPSPCNPTPGVDVTNGIKREESQTSSNIEEATSTQKLHRWIRMPKLANLVSKSSLSFSRIEARSKNENRRQIYALSDRTFASSLNEFAAEDDKIDVTSEQKNHFPLNFSKRSISLNDLQHEVIESTNMGQPSMPVKNEVLRLDDELQCDDVQREQVSTIDVQIRNGNNVIVTNL